MANELSEEEWLVTQQAWRGSAFGNTRNIIGGIAFMVVVLFFLESFCKLLIGEDTIRHDLKLRNGARVGLAKVLDWLRQQTRISQKELDAVEFLNRYRNAWHSFGRYAGKSISAAGFSLSPGERLPVIQTEARLNLLADLFEVFLEVNRLYPNL